jgi:ferric-dicitrate binding protein FerR (iron transport regulator)
MSRNEEHLDRLLDRAIDQIRDDSAGDEVVTSAAGRVWGRLQAELERKAGEDPALAPIRTCADYQKMLPAYLEGRLSDARRLLLEDHSRECFACRKALKQARSGRTAASVPRTAPRSRKRLGLRADLSWGLAAAIIIGVALVGFAFNTDFFRFSTGGWLQIDVVDGSLLEVGDAVVSPVIAGETLDNGEWIRTTKESGAVFTLDDGSKVEMNERSELFVTKRGKDNTIHLARGGIIVEAADQGSGHLYVDASDCTVAVTGTVFSVTRGTKGSRVSVIEGEVVVDRNGDEHILRPGDQLTTSDNLARIPVQTDIAWSRDADKHLALLHEFVEFRRELEERLPEPTLRTSTRLLDAVPEGTVVYVAVPNLTSSITEAHKLLEEKVQSNGALNSWWQENVVATGAEPEITRVMEKIRQFGDQLGDEIVVAVPKPRNGEMNAPVFLATVKQPDGFRTMLHEELVALHESVQDMPDLRIVEDPFSVPSGAADHDALTFWISGEILAASPEIDALRHMASLHGSPETGRFVGSPFHRRLAETYRDGVNLLVGVDLEAILQDEAIRAGEGAEVLDKMGIADIRHLVFERHQDDGKNLTTASLSFNQERRGIAAWLAEPAPMGSLEFVSPDAMAVASFVVRNPASMLGGFLDDMAATDGRFRTELERFQNEYNIDLVQDVAGPLGGEVTIALDGPPRNAPWKLILEIYDPARLQRTLEWAVDQANAMAEREGHPLRLALTTTERGGRTYYSLGSEEHGLAAHYTFVDGYLVAASQDVMLDRAIQYRRAGATLPASGEFLSLLPKDGQADFSALVYQNLGSILGPVIQNTIGNLESLTPEQRRMIDEMTAETRPSLFCAYGYRDRIDVVCADRGGLLGSDIGNLFNLGCLMELRRSMTNLPHESGNAVYH